jgi:hypothetical protein
MQYRLIMATLALSVYAAPAPMITGAPSLSRRQDGGGATGGSSVLKEPMTIAAGESFDGGNAVFDRGVSCTGQEEGGDSDAVFILEKGATLSNVRIGKSNKSRRCGASSNRCYFRSQPDRGCPLQRWLHLEQRRLGCRL